MRQPLDINIQGSEFTIAKRNEELLKDLQIYSGLELPSELMNRECTEDEIDKFKCRPFLHGQERSDMCEYFYNGYIRNHIIGLLTYDKSGNFLPDAYSAPIEYQKVLYPIEDLINYDRQGTLIIDREQYSPELRHLSFFVYMVDEELYNEYKDKQNFLGDRLPTFMFDRHNPNGVRVFKDYYSLVRHLKRQRDITYCLGPRTMFYIRYYLHEIHVHTIEDKYAYGRKLNDGIASKVYKSVLRHLAFRTTKTLEYNGKYVQDEYKLLRNLATKYAITIPEVKEFNCKTMIQRYSKQTMHNKVVCRLKNNKVKKYLSLGIQPYHHCLIHDDHAIFYIWDTRTIEAIIPLTEFEQGDFTYNVVDNRNDIKVTLEQSSDIRKYLEEHKYDIPVQFRYNEPASTFDGSEEHHFKNFDADGNEI